MSNWARVFITFNFQISDGKMTLFTGENMYDLYKEIYMQNKKNQQKNNL